jgi:hypothetical protein
MVVNLLHVLLRGPAEIRVFFQHDVEAHSDDHLGGNARRGDSTLPKQKTYNGAIHAGIGTRYGCPVRCSS